MNHIPSPLMELGIIELQREIERRRHYTTRSSAALHFPAVRRTIGKSMIRAGMSIAGIPGSGA